LTPGASSQINNYVNTPVGGDSNVEFNGMRQNHNIYLLDGGRTTTAAARRHEYWPSTDAIAEFRALTSNYSADYGPLRSHDDDGSEVRNQHVACFGVGVQSQRCFRCAQLF